MKKKKGEKMIKKKYFGIYLMNLNRDNINKILNLKQRSKKIKILKNNHIKYIINYSN